MSINLSKGETVNLQKEAPGLVKAQLGAGWDTTGNGIDLDLYTVALKADGKAVSDKHLCYFGQKSTPAMVHSGDNRTGEGEGDDEVITIDFSKLPEDAVKVRVGVTFYNHNGRNLDVVQNAFARVVNTADNKEVAKYTITSGATGKTLNFVDFEKGAEGWAMKAIGEFTNEDFQKGEVTAKFGL